MRISLSKKEDFFFLKQRARPTGLPRSRFLAQPSSQASVPSSPQEPTGRSPAVYWGRVGSSDRKAGHADMCYSLVTSR